MPPGAHSAAGIAGVDPKTVRRYVQARDEGRPVTGPSRRARITDLYLAKIEEWVDRSQGKVRADVVHERLVAVGFTGDERTTRRAVADPLYTATLRVEGIVKPCESVCHGGTARHLPGLAAPS